MATTSLYASMYGNIMGEQYTMGTVVKREPQVKPKLEATLVKPELVFDDKKQDLMEDLGLDGSPAFMHEMIVDWFAKKEVKTYDIKEVTSFLNWYGRTRSLEAFWRPLREFDIPKERVILGHRAYAFSAPYPKAIPFGLLRMVRNVESDLGRENLSFIVSDFHERLPDPFLAVTPRAMFTEGFGSQVHMVTVFAKWDEPTWDDFKNEQKKGS